MPTSHPVVLVADDEEACTAANIAEVRRMLPSVATASVAPTVGIYARTSALFFAARASLLWVAHRATLQLAEQRQQLERLAQELALLSQRPRAGTRAESPPKAG